MTKAAARARNAAERIETPSPVTPEPEGEATAEAAPPPPQGHVYSPEDSGRDLAERLRNRHMPTGKAALAPGEIIKRRTLRFQIDGVECEPGMFVDDNGEYVTFWVTLRSLDSGQEVSALQGIKDGTQAPMMMCKQAFYALNDKPLTPEERNFFWECLGTPGRQIAMIAFHQLGAASEASLGKYLMSRSED